MAVDIVKKMKQIKRCDIIGFPLLGPPIGLVLAKSVGKIRTLGKLWSEYLPISYLIKT
jgi:hypothetical protein